MKIAECYDHLEETSNSIHAYYQVLSLEPLQIPVRFKLSALLRASGREDEAMSLLAGLYAMLELCETVSIIVDRFSHLYWTLPF